MTNQLAIAIGLVIVAIFGIDWLLFGGHLPLFLGRTFVEFVEYLSFWR